MKKAKNRGLSKEASIFLEENEKFETDVEGDRKRVDLNLPCDNPYLYEYELDDGRKVREIVQSTVDISADLSLVFLCLEDEARKRIGEWTMEEMAEEVEDSRAQDDFDPDWGNF